MSTELLNTVQNSEHIDSIQLSRALRPNVEEEAFYKELTLGIEESLQAHPMIRDIKMIMRPPVQMPAISSWERKNSVKLPSDLKNYYLSTNGFKLTWNLDYAGDVLKIGEICVNSLQQLNAFESGFTAKTTAPVAPAAGSSDQYEIPGAIGTGKQSADSYLRISFQELQKTIESAKKGSKKSTTKTSALSLGEKGKAFLLDSSHPELGTVCLVYQNGACPVGKHTLGKYHRSTSSESNKTIIEPEIQIWFLDPSYQWSFLAPTFSHYYRMLLYHQGMPQWQYRFTSFGISTWAEQMFWLVTPHLLQPEKIGSGAAKDDKTIWSLDIPSEAATPNSTMNSIDINIFRKKKKDKRN